MRSQELLIKPECGHQWLLNLRTVSLEEAVPVTVGRDIAARQLTMCGNHGLALQLT
jgi:hypothetical protein